MQTPKNLIQTALAATTLTDLYDVPAATSTVVSSVVVCNRGGTIATFRLAVALAGASDASEQYLYYEQPIEPNDTFIATIGMTLQATDVIRGFASNANISMNGFGVENS